MHPSITEKLAYFEYAHLSPELQEISRPFGVLANDLAAKLEGPQLTIALQKLLEAKDCAVRAALG